MWLLQRRARAGPPGDRYTDFTLWQVLIPFASSTCRPLWVGQGQLALYLSMLVTVTFCLRRWIGSRTWRAIIVLSLVASALALAHGIWSGTDSAAGWVRALSAAAVARASRCCRCTVSERPAVGRRLGLGAPGDLDVHVGGLQRGPPAC